MNAGLRRLVAMICIAGSGTAAAATLTTVQDGVYWCTSPANCAWGGSGIPGPADTGVIAHTTTLWGQGANPPATSPVSVGRLDIVSGGSMGMHGDTWDATYHYDPAGHWLGAQNVACSSSARIYCFEY